MIAKMVCVNGEVWSYELQQPLPGLMELIPNVIWPASGGQYELIPSDGADLVYCERQPTGGALCA